MGSSFHKLLQSQEQEDNSKNDNGVKPFEKKSRIWIEDGGEEEEEGAVYRVTLKKVQIIQDADEEERSLEVDGDQLPPEHTTSQVETIKTRAIKAGTLERLVKNLLTSHGDNDFSYIPTFLSTYKAFASTKEVLELLLDRYGNLENSNCEDLSQSCTETLTNLRNDDNMETSNYEKNGKKSSTETLTQFRTDENTEAPNYEDIGSKSSTETITEFRNDENLKPSLSEDDGSQIPIDVIVELRNYSNCEEEYSSNSAMEKNELRKAIGSVLTTWLKLCPEDFQEPPHFPSLRRVLEFIERFMPGTELQSKAEKLLEALQIEELMKDASLRSKYIPEEVTEVNGSEDFSLFPEDEIAELLTYVDGRLFKSVAAHHGLGCIWAQRYKTENPYLACSIKATVAQFNAVAQCVTTTILRDRTLRKKRRAKIIEKWINIAYECRILKNFSSSKAILAALRSAPVHRLKKTWAHVAKDSLLMMEELSEIFSEEDNNSNLRELLKKEGTSKFATINSRVHKAREIIWRRLQKQKDMGVMQGTVPYLGTFLTDMTMLDTALRNHTEGGLINFDKRRKEFEVISEIRVLQAVISTHYIPKDKRFHQWFKKQEFLTENESYQYSCEIEPPAKKKTSSPQPRRSLMQRLGL